MTALLAGVALAVAGCGGGGDAGGAAGGDTGGEQQSIRLVVAQYTEGTQPYWNQLIEKFEGEHPGTSVDLQVIDWSNLQSQVNTMVQTQQLPDVLNYNLFADFAEADLLYRADELMSPEQLADFLPTFAGNASYDGQQYAFPFVGTVNGLYYNKTILAEAGIAAPPTTWDEFLVAAEKIKALPGGYVPYAMALGAESADYEFGTWARANGGDWMTDGQWTIDSERNVETLEFLRLLTERGYTQPNPGQTNRADGTWPLFAQGKAAMVYGSFGTRAFMEPIRESGIDYGITTHPTNHGAAPATHGIQDYLMAFRKDGNQQLVSQFLAYFYRPENYTEYLRVEGLLPTTTSGSEQFAQDPATAEFVGLIPEARFAPTSEPVWAELRGAMITQLGTGVSPEADPRRLLGEFQAIAQSGP